MSFSKIEGTLSVQTLLPQSITLPVSCIDDANIVAGAAIVQTKLQHKFQQVIAQQGTASTVAERHVVHVVRGSNANVLSFKCGVIVAGTGTSTTAVDLQKNGTTMLSGGVAVGTTAAYSLLTASLASTTLVAGDVLEVVVSSVAPGSGAVSKGLFAVTELEEDSL